MFIDGPVDETPDISNIDVVRVDKPPVSDSMEGRTGHVDQQRREVSYTARERDEIDCDATFCVELFNVTVRNP